MRHDDREQRPGGPPGGRINTPSNSWPLAPNHRNGSASPAQTSSGRFPRRRPGGQHQAGTHGGHVELPEQAACLQDHLGFSRRRPSELLQPDRQPLGDELQGAAHAGHDPHPDCAALLVWSRAHDHRIAEATATLMAVATELIASG